MEIGPFYPQKTCQMYPNLFICIEEGVNKNNCNICHNSSDPLYAFCLRFRLANIFHLTNFSEVTILNVARKFIPFNDGLYNVLFNELHFKNIFY